MSSLPSGLSRRSPRLLTATLLLGAAACSQASVEAPRPATAPGAAPALRVYRDPNTGAFGEPPPGAAPAAPTRAAAPVALPEQAAPGGGRMIRLNGAFRTQMVGRLAASTATVSCTSTPRAPRATTAAAP